MAPPAASHPLATVLDGFDDERLTALLTARPDLSDPPPSDLAGLANRAESWPSVCACYRSLDRWCHQVVQALCLLPARTTVADLAGLLGPDAELGDVEAAVDRLADRALLVRSDSALELLPVFAELPSPAGLGPPAATVLATHSSGQLAEMARRLHTKPGTTKTATLAAVAAALSDPEGIQCLLDDGPPGTAELVRRLVEEGPAAYVPPGLYGPTVADRTPFGWLVNRGVLASVSWHTAVMPAEAGLALRGGRPFPRLANRRPVLPPAPVGTEVVDGAAAQAALRLVADVITILDGWATAPPTLLKAGGLGIRDVRRAAKLTGRSEVEAARIVDLAAAAGLADVDRATDAVLPSAAYDDWLPLEPARRWATLAAAWWAWPYHLGLTGVTGIKGKPIPPLLDRLTEPEAVPRRHAVLGLLAGMEAGAGIDAGHLRARLEWEAPLLWSGGPARPSMLADWVVEEAELVGLCSRGALATAGRLVDAGRGEEAVAVLAAHAPPVSSAFVVQADLTVVAPGELAAPVRAELELVADVESKGSATVYRLSESSLRRGLEAGRTADEILGLLEGHATRAVPQSLAYLIADLGRRFGQVRVGSAPCYVRSDDPSLLAEVVRSRRTARLGLRLLAPTVAITDADPPTVLATLRGGGYLPAPEGADGGLVLARPAARRAPVRRPPPGHAGRRGSGSHDDSGALGPGGPDGATSGPDPAALVALVGRLRKAPPSPPSPSSSRKTPAARPVPPGHAPPPPPFRPPPAPFPQPDLFDDESRRPLEIAKGRADVALLLGQAFVEDWMVRIAYTNRKGRSSQLNIVVIDDPADDVLVECLPGCTSRTLMLDQIEWARVMTEAEEELLF